MSADLFPKLRPGVTAAVSFIPERETGDITALGNLWRDRIEKILAQRGVVVKARRDIITLIEDMDSFGGGRDEQDIWDAAGAEILVCGNYTLFKSEDGKDHGSIRVVTKAYRGSVLVDAEEFLEPLDPSWTGLAAKIFGNVHQEKFEVVSSGTASGPIPELDVTLNRKSNCFAPGEKAKLHVRTRPGIHLYIFNLTADGNVTLIYPNKWMADRPLAFGDFVFPPEDKHGIELRLFPLEDGKTCRESFKIVASLKKLDFSFLPFPENQIYKGSNGKDIDRMTAVLKQAGDYGEKSVVYFVGGTCD